MRGVVIRAEGNTKNLAGFAAYISEEFFLFSRAIIPMLEHRNPVPRFKFKGGDVPRIGKGVFTPLTAAISFLLSA